MNFGKDKPLRQFKWYIPAICALLVIGALLAVLSGFFKMPQAGWIPQFAWFLIILGILVAFILMFLKVSDVLAENGAKLDKVAETLEKNRSVLAQINQSTRISETAKTIAYRDADKRALREAVFDKLQQQDYETTYKMIDEIAHFPGYQQLAEQLQIEADKYRDATDAERENQVIAHIGRLLEDHQWARASTQIERLIKDKPDSEKAEAMRQKLLDKKQERKKILLTAWDDAVKRQATDRSLEILRELDLYLTPNEGLALQEAARDVFRTKLHNLGVQFSFAISGKDWLTALQTGRQIIRDFPNSRMAEEIRESMETLRQKVGQQSTG